MGRCWSKGTNFQLHKMNTFWGSNVQMITIDNNTIFYTWSFPRVELGYSYYHQHPKVTMFSDGCVNQLDCGVIISQVYVYEIFLLYTLNIYNFIFQLYMNKAEKKSDWTRLNWFKHYFPPPNHHIEVYEGVLKNYF